MFLHSENNKYINRKCPQSFNKFMYFEGIVHLNHISVPSFFSIPCTIDSIILCHGAIVLRTTFSPNTTATPVPSPSLPATAFIKIQSRFISVLKIGEKAYAKWAAIKIQSRFISVLKIGEKAYAKRALYLNKNYSYCSYKPFYHNVVKKVV
jgi:hypothetical protein